MPQGSGRPPRNQRSEEQARWAESPQSKAAALVGGFRHAGEQGRGEQGRGEQGLWGPQPGTRR